MTARRAAEEFQQAALEHQITRWPLHRCSICDYLCSYLMEGPQVGYDSGCDCTGRYMVELRSFQDLADHYNMQSAPSVIAGYDAFWHFDDGGVGEQS